MTQMNFNYNWIKYSLIGSRFRESSFNTKKSYLIAISRDFVLDFKDVPADLRRFLPSFGITVISYLFLF